MYVSIGEGATSEGEFWESLNSACLGRLPVVYLVEDNGYAISVPVEVQTAGGDISKLVASFPGLFVQSIDGTDFVESYSAMTRAVAYARARKGPALVHAQVVRPYSHSLSDDEKLYKTPDERAAEAQARSDSRLAAFLKAEGIASEADLEAIAQRGRREVNAAADARDRSAESPRRHRRRSIVYSPDVDPTSDRVQHAAGAARASRTRWSPRSTARSKTRWRAIRASSCSARTSRTRAARRHSASAPARAASSRSRTACSARSATPACSTRRSPRPTSSAAPSAWRSAASSRWSRFSSSTTSGRR